jgi:hypothetical protein
MPILVGLVAYIPEEVWVAIAIATGIGMVEYGNMTGTLKPWA